jgi:hypothetical protein
MRRIIKSFVIVVCLTCLLNVQSVAASYEQKVVEHLNTLLSNGKDRYGSTYSPLFMTVIDDDTLAATDDPNYSDLGGRVPPDSRSLGGANLWWQASLMEVMDRMGKINSDFSLAAQLHISYYIDNFFVFDGYGTQGMLWWGDHLNHNAFNETLVVPTKEEHQINMHFQNPMKMWDMMWRYRPVQTANEIEQLWQMHVFDKQVGKWDRHARNQERWSVGFAEAGASFMRAFAFMYSKTGEQVWKDRAELLRDHMWNQRDTSTNLLPSAANTCSERGDDFYRRLYSNNSTPGMWVPALVYCYKIFGDAQWRQQAEDTMQGWLTYAYDDSQREFYKWIRIDGVYEPDYQEIEAGHSSFWRNSPNFRNSGKIVDGFLDTYEICRKQFLLDGARLIGDKLLTQTPVSDTGTGPGTFAENYARAINIMLRLHRFTGDQQYLDRAVYMADHAVDHLWNSQNKIFRGHYNHGYEVADGVDMLTFTLVDLDRYLTRDTAGIWSDEFTEDTIMTGRWVENSQQDSSAWIDTSGDGKLVISDQNTAGGVALKRGFDTISDGKSLSIEFDLRVNGTEDDIISISFENEFGVAALSIGVGEDQGLLRWKYQGDQQAWLNRYCVAGERLSFKVQAVGYSAYIYVNGILASSAITLNNDIAAKDITQIEISTSELSQGSVEFESVRISQEERPYYDLLKPFIRDWLRLSGETMPLSPEQPLELWYRFDESSGGIANDSAGDTDGILENFTSYESCWQEGLYGRAIKLNGIDQWIDIPDTFFAEFHNKTIAVWFKVTDIPAAASRIFATRSSYRIYLTIDTDMRLTAQFSDVGVAGYADIELDRWTHAAIVMADVPDENQLAHLYVDGMLIGTTPPFVRHTASSLTGANLGSYNNGNGGFANVLLDEFKVFDDALSSANIAWLAMLPTDIDQNGITDLADIAILFNNK